MNSALKCAYCDKTYVTGTSPSDDFCSEPCSRRWTQDVLEFGEPRPPVSDKPVPISGPYTQHPDGRIQFSQGSRIWVRYPDRLDWIEITAAEITYTRDLDPLWPEDEWSTDDDAGALGE